MTIYRDHLTIRGLGTFFGLCFLLIGAYSLLGDQVSLEAAAGDRAFWFGVTMLIAGLMALTLSWLIKDVNGVWCSPPKRW